MKYVVLFQDRITKRTVDAKSESEAAAKAQKLLKGKLLVISCTLKPKE